MKVFCENVECYFFDKNTRECFNDEINLIEDGLNINGYGKMKILKCIDYSKRKVDER